MATASARKRVLFVAEAVTLAHVARPAALLAALDTQRYDCFLACDPRARRFVTLADERCRPLQSLAADRFADRLRRGAPVYSAEELQAYVAADLALLEQLQPDLVVGDFRLSLSVSARLAGLPYAAITNAYWSPWTADRSLPLPVLPWTGRVPLALAQRGFDLVQPLALAQHCRPLNQVRSAHGMPPLPADLRRIYTDADHTLYADSPTLFPTPGAPANHHHHLGPVIWSPPVPDPPWWNELRDDLPIVYVTMGSSGRVELLDLVFDALADLNVQVAASTAGAALRGGQRPRVRVADYLPGAQVAARAALVICNGGSPTSQQAIAGGAPVLGICANMDQMLNMRGLEAASLGTALRVDRLAVSGIHTAAKSLLARDKVADAAGFARAAGPDSQRSFAAFVESLLG